MSNEPKQHDKRKSDPYLDRRSGEDRREAYSLEYFAAGKPERRRATERRQIKERRDRCVKVSRWSSVCAQDDQ